MNPAAAHLDAKLRFFWDFTVGQIAAAFVGTLFGFAWAMYLSPFHGLLAAVSGAYVGGLPVAAAFIASQTEFDLWTIMVAAFRWRGSEGRYEPGAGAVSGYVLSGDEDPSSGAHRVGELDLEALWDAP